MYGKNITVRCRGRETVKRPYTVHLAIDTLDMINIQIQTIKICTKRKRVPHAKHRKTQ